MCTKSLNICTYQNYYFIFLYITFWRFIMWTTPSAVEMRFGFEVTLYVMNR